MSQESGSDQSDESIQELIDRAMPPIQKDDPSAEIADHEELNFLRDLIWATVDAFKEGGFNANDIHLVLGPIEHHLNAQRWDKHEYDRIALTLETRKFIEGWRDQQEDEIPVSEIAYTVEELGRYYRTLAREEAERNDRQRDTDR